MVVKPLDFVVRGKKGLVQPAVKCRGPEYLRIIYGPEYDAPESPFHADAFAVTFAGPAFGSSKWPRV